MPNDLEWAREPKGAAEDHWIDLAHKPDSDGNYWMHAAVKWDGCIHLHVVANLPLNVTERFGDHKTEHPQLVDYLHICDLEEHIKDMQALLSAAKAHFGGDWPR